MKNFAITLLAILTLVTAQGAGAQMFEDEKLVASDGMSGDKFGGAVARARNLLFIGAPDNDGQALRAGAVYVFRRVGPDFGQVDKLVASDGVANGRFGVSVAATKNGSTVAVGARGTRTVYIFEQQQPSGNYVEMQKLTNPNPSFSDAFGRSLALSADGRILMVGNPETTPLGLPLGPGSVQIFQRSAAGSPFLPTDLLVASNSTNGADFGVSVAIDPGGARVVVGAPRAPGAQGVPGGGAAYVYEPDVTGAFGEMAILTIPSFGQAQAGFGASVDLEGSTIVVGADDRPDSLDTSIGGFVYVFEDQGGGFVSSQELLASTGALIGEIVAIDGDTIVTEGSIGGVNSLESSAFVYQRDSTGTFTEIHELEASDSVLRDSFGVALALDRCHVAVGAPGQFSAITFNGTTYEYKLFRAQGSASTLSVSDGTFTVSLDAGPANGGHSYILLASAAGTTPGTPFGSFQIPLNMDPLLQTILSGPNTPRFGNFSGVLDSSGLATATINLPAGLIPNQAGTDLHFAAVLLDSSGGKLRCVSNVIPLGLVP